VATETPSRRGMIHPHYRPDIDGMRALAVLSVMVYHAFPQTVPGGFIGVDIFFVISGFLISTILLTNLKKNSFGFVEFYQRRVLRIFPALSVMMVFCYALGWLLLLAADFAQLSKHIVAGAGFVSNFILWGEASYFDKAAENKPLLHLWSLGIEEQFYLAWPLLLWLASKMRLNPIIVCVAIFLASFGFSLRHLHHDQSAAFYSPLLRFWELTLGSTLAWLTLHPIRNFSFNIMARSCTAILGLGMIVYALFAPDIKLFFPGWAALLPTCGTVLLIASGHGTFINRAVLSNRLFVWVGLVSYPLYLWHWPLLVFLHLSCPNLAGSEEASAKLATLALSVLIAAGTHQFLENKIRNGKNSGRKAIALCILMLGIAATGYITVKTDGLPIRFPQEIRDIASLHAGNEDFSFEAYKTDRACGNEGFNILCSESGRPIVFLWGDSHAESLYPGFNTLQRAHSFSIWQSTGCGNPPYVSLSHFTDRSTCGENEPRLKANLTTIDVIKKIHPEIIILHARWAYDHYALTPEETVGKLRETISLVHAVSPTSSVVVLGPAPNWRDTLAHMMVEYWKTSPAHAMPPAYMDMGLEKKIAVWDAYMAQHVPSKGVRYISVYKILCNADGCLTRTGPKPTDITAIDYGHLSPAGSAYLVAHIADMLFRPTISP